MATHNMDQFKNKGFDFYANAQYPLIMKQQTIDDKVIKDLFGASGNELQEIRTASERRIDNQRPDGICTWDG